MLSKGTLWAGVISAGFALWRDAGAHRSGRLDDREYAVHTTSDLTSALGLMAGFEYGACLGSAIVPGAGAVIGTILGGIVGDRLGQALGQGAGSALFPERSPQGISERNPMQNHT
ncbi:Hypothetical protein DEACI_1111 [Acididesulfobacillus acetoxydans]|uniref:Glycine zipper domain-containing protein n=1 Tax=Acididesulfobacillus acetoxydans TaxID=1561005 RepID=A0A8S0W269_9FIRM|nr:hypothetical protein [Acididesulfobacillus acetoxydans]CAA7600458.1 Hypothetical protein DEACI_1111 [Acididesulfobacillus acetoxydans]CEJ06592.1 Hypothetical protein DEACI_1041 [Acididesulfobacillus acetoxydans]